MFSNFKAICNVVFANLASYCGDIKSPSTIKVIILYHFVDDLAQCVE